MEFALIPAAYVFLIRNAEVLMQLRRGTGYMDGHWTAAAAGHLEPGETVQQCAVREAAEELGVVLDPFALRPLTVMVRTDGSNTPREQRVDWFFTADRWGGHPRVVEPAKCAEIAWHPLEDLPSPIPPYEHDVLSGWLAGSVPIFSHHGFAPPSARPHAPG